MQTCLCGAANCRGVLGPRPKDGKKPSSQAEKDNYAAGLKRKAAEILDEPSVTEQLRALLTKKRKVKQFSKGWVYVDTSMEAARQEEALLDREIARLQREGKTDSSKEVTKTSGLQKGRRRTTSVIVKLEEKVKIKTAGSKARNDDIPKERKRSSMLGRLSGSFRRVQEEAPASQMEKRKSTSSFRQSTLSFQRLDPVDVEDEEELIERPPTSSSIKRTITSAKNSLIGRKGSAKIKSVAREGARRSSTLRLVEGDE